MNAQDILETQRLILRPVRADDAPVIQQIFPHFEVVQYMSQIPWPYPADGAAQFLNTIALPGMKNGTHWLWAITLKGDDTLRGLVHLRRFEKKNRGFWLDPTLKGHAYMTEAVRAVNAHAFTKLGFEKIRTSHAVPNAASRRVKEKTGGTLVGMWEENFTGGRFPAEIWELTKEDWEKQRLRKCLDNMVNRNPSDPASIQEHPAAIALLKEQHPHTIVPLIQEDWGTSSNCVMYALGLQESDFENTSNVLGQYYADIGLVEHLLEKEALIECDFEDAKYIIYKNHKNKISHIGLLDKERKVISKWGCGLVYTHDFLEVPLEYGPQYFFCHSSSKLDDEINTYFRSVKCLSI